MDENETKIIEQAAKGDIHAFSKLIQQYQDSIRTMLAVRLGRHHEAEDLAQETFIIAFRKLKDFDHQHTFGAWLRGIASNLMRNHWRKARETSVGGIAELDLMLDHQIEKLEQTENLSLEALNHCVSKLKDDAKQIVHWRYFMKLSMKEICDKLKKKHSAITMKLHRLRIELKTCIEDTQAQSLKK